MRALKALAVAAAVCGLFLVVGRVAPAEASENYIGNMADGGNLTRCFRPGGSGIKAITFQCPGQTVYVKAGYGGYADAGPGAVYVDFSQGQDSYPFPLATSLGQTHICIRTLDAGVVACNFYQVAQ